MMIPRTIAKSHGVSRARTYIAVRITALGIANWMPHRFAVVLAGVRLKLQNRSRSNWCGFGQKRQGGRFSLLALKSHSFNRRRCRDLTLEERISYASF
jgi:hypothetical protein